MLQPLHADPNEPVSARREPVSEPADPLHVQVGLLVAGIVVMLDQATKHLAEQLLVRGRMVPVINEEIGLQLVYNPGGAFGFLAPSWVFIIVTVVVTVFTIHNLPRSTSMLQASAWGLLLAGALGNGLDRIFRPGGPGARRFLEGEVVDFVAIYSFPRFNIADMAITMGFFLLVASFWRDELEASDEQS